MPRCPGRAPPDRWCTGAVERWPASTFSAAPMPWEQPRAVSASRARCAAALAYRAVSAATLGRPGRCAAAARSRTRALTASSYAPLTRRGARFVSTGTTMRVAERAGGRGPTVHIPGVAAAAAAAAAAALAAARRSRESGFQGACSASVWMAPGIRRRSARGQLGEAPGRLPLGRARPGGHPRPRRRWSWPRRSVSAALIVVCDCVCVLSQKNRCNGRQLLYLHSTT